MVICMSDVLSYWKCEIRAFMEPWFWLVWWHTLAKWFCLLQFNYCFIHAGQAVECWEYVVPQPEQGLETFDFNFLFVQIRLAECLLMWVGMISKCWFKSFSMFNSLIERFEIFSLGTNVCKILVFNPCKNWSFAWMDFNSAWHEQHEYWQSWAINFSWTITSCMGSSFDRDRLAKLRQYTVGLEHLVMMVSMVWTIFCLMRLKKSALVLN